MANYKTMIHIDGRSIDDIFRLPCVRGCKKTSIKGIFEFTFYPLDMAHPSQFQYAATGDWLCERQDGKWVILREDIHGETKEL